MSISLNNHESRIKTLENKNTALPSYSGSTSYNFPGGLQLRVGSISIPNRETWNSYKFGSPFSNACVSLCVTKYYGTSGDLLDNMIDVKLVNKAGFSAGNNKLNDSNYSSLTGYYIAIGY